MPVDVHPPPITVEGDSDANVTINGLTDSEAVWVRPPAEAEKVTLVGAVTGDVLIGNEAVLVAAETVTESGAVATAVLLLVTVTITPPTGAGPIREIVPGAAFPPTMLEGDMPKPATNGGLTVKTAFFGHLRRTCCDGHSLGRRNRYGHNRESGLSLASEYRHSRGHSSDCRVAAREGYYQSPRRAGPVRVSVPALVAPL